jgi:hypothetical protein
VDYVGRVIDRLDTEAAPAAEDYGFGQFVSLPVGGDGGEVAGVIYDTQLVNPEYGSLGPRLSPPSELAVLSPDYLNEQGVLVGLLLLGWRDAAGDAHHAVPRRVIPVGQDVFAMPDEEVLEFHRDAGGQLRLHYFSQVLARAGASALPLLEAVLEQLERGVSAEERQRFCVLRRSLAWQRTMGGMRL